MSISHPNSAIGSYGVGLSNFREPEEGLGQPVLFE